MDIFNITKGMFGFSSKEQRKAEEQLYSAVTEEIERNEIHKPLWTKALAESDNDKQKAQALYIKYRIQKLKDEIDDQKELQKKQEKQEVRARAEAHRARAKARKDKNKLGTLDATVESTVSTFRWLILAMGMLSVGILFFAYLFYNSGDPYELWIFTGVVFISLALHLLYLTKKVSKADEYSKIKSRLNILFSTLIPFSLLGTVFVIVSPIIGFFMFIAFVVLSIHAIKFYRAFSYAKKNNLI